MEGALLHILPMLLLMESSTAGIILLSSSWRKETTTMSSRLLHTRRMGPHHLLNQQTWSQSRNPRATHKSNHFEWFLPIFQGSSQKKKKKEGCRPSHVEIHVKLVYKLFSVCKLIWEVIDILKTKKAWSNVFFFFQLILLEILCDGINNVL